MKPFEQINHYLIRLSDDEWGNETMERKAREFLATLPILPGVGNYVEVYEHGGWFLAWTMIDGELVTVGTANDQARLNPKGADWRKAAYHAEWKYREVNPVQLAIAC